MNKSRILRGNTEHYTNAKCTFQWFFFDLYLHAFGRVDIISWYYGADHMYRRRLPTYRNCCAAQSENVPVPARN